MKKLETLERLATKTLIAPFISPLPKRGYGGLSVHLKVPTEHVLPSVIKIIESIA